MQSAADSQFGWPIYAIQVAVALGAFSAIWMWSMSIVERLLFQVKANLDLANASEGATIDGSQKQAMGLPDYANVAGVGAISLIVLHLMLSALIALVHASNGGEVSILYVLLVRVITIGGTFAITAAQLSRSAKKEFQVAAAWTFFGTAISLAVFIPVVLALIGSWYWI